MTYLKNTWYMAAFADEVPNDRALGRCLLGTMVALFRDAEGAVRAIDDRCAHRFAPLHKGKVVGGTLQCPYHGLRYAPGGQCVHNPHGNGRIPSGARVRGYSTAERYGIVWMWPGDPEAADPSLIPDFSSMDPAKRFVGKGYLPVRANYQLETDNIMDLSHIEYLHPGSLGSDAVKAASAQVEQVGETVYSKRLTRAERLPEALEDRFGVPAGQLVDRWLDVRWDAPACMELWVGIAPTGLEDPRADGKRIPYLHIFTPETEHSAHYWYATSYPRRMGDEGARRAASDAEFLRAPFESEDLPMLEDQQRNMGDVEFWSLKPVLLPGDAAAVRARRVLEGLIKAEQVGAKAPQETLITRNGDKE
jgi:phenylpropionate dioxygenase-like ring-hydroxylating dioxygenase large terminal subunit